MSWEHKIKGLPARTPRRGGSSTPDYILCACPFGHAHVLTRGEWRTEGCGFSLAAKGEELTFADISGEACQGALFTPPVIEASPDPEAPDAPAEASSEVS